MTAPTQVALREVPAQAWRNGGGVTRELMAWPAGDDWQWRISVADIDRDGPFSAFPGVARWFAVLAGAGVELGLPEGPVRLSVADEACAFDGSAAPACRLIDGSTRDLNLMLRRLDGGMHRADDGAAWQPAGGQCGLFSPVAGCVHVAHGGEDDVVVVAVPAMSLSWWFAAPGRLVFHADPNPGAERPHAQGCTPRFAGPSERDASAPVGRPSGGAHERTLRPVGRSRQAGMSPFGRPSGAHAWWLAARPHAE